MASTIYKGKNLRFSFNGKTLYHATSCKFSISTKLEAIATKDTNGTVSTPSNYEWSLSADALVANRIGSTQNDFMDLIDLQLAGAQIAVEFTTGITDDFVLSGNVYIESSDVTAETGNSVTGSFSFKGNGDLTQTAATVVLPAVPFITSGASAYIFSGVAFSYQIYATNSPTSYSATGLPAGLSINTSTGLISGTPSTGTMSMTVSATNAGGTGNKTVANVTLDGNPPTAPSALSVSGITATEFLLSFTGSTYNGGTLNTNIERYEFYKNGTYFNYDTGDTSSKLIQSQTSGATNLWKIRAKAVDGQYSSFSSETSVTQL
jgi:hypothetical protein